MKVSFVTFFFNVDVYFFTLQNSFYALCILKMCFIVYVLWRYFDVRRFNRAFYCFYIEAIL